MDSKTLLKCKGKEVINKMKEIGTIIDVDYSIHVEFADGRISKYSSDSFEKGFLKLANSSDQKCIDRFIEKEQEKEARFEEEYFEYTKKESERKEQKAREKALKEKFGKLYNKNLDLSNPMGIEDIRDKYKITKLFTSKETGQTTERPTKDINIKDDCIVLLSCKKKIKDEFRFLDYYKDNGDFIFNYKRTSKSGEIYSGCQKIIDSKENNMPIYVLVKASADEYYYQGEFEYINLFRTKIEDDSGKIIDKYEFTLRKKG